MTIPEPVFWSALTLAVLSLVSLAVKVLGNGNSIKQLDDAKQSKVDCLTKHGPLDVEIMAISKDVEAIDLKARIAPQP